MLSNASLCLCQLENPPSPNFHPHPCRPKLSVPSPAPRPVGTLPAFPFSPAHKQKAHRIPPAGFKLFHSSTLPLFPDYTLALLFFSIFQFLFSVFISHSTLHAAFSSPSGTSTCPSAGITSIGNPPCHNATPSVNFVIPFNSSASFRIATSSVR